MTDPRDPKGLLSEAYQIAGVSPEECRSIFVDWALSLPDDADTTEAVKAQYAVYAGRFPDHPMTAVLREGLADAPKPARRGGGRARRS